MLTALKIFGVTAGLVTIVSAFSAPNYEEPVKTTPSISTTSQIKPIVKEEIVIEPEVVNKVKIPTPAPATKNTSNCHTGYSGCLKVNAGDYDCAGGSGNGPNYTGQVRVYGSDPFDLDRDGDGIGCE